MLLLLARASTRSHPTPLSCVPHGDAVSMSLLPPRFPPGIPSSYVSMSESLSLLTLHSSLLASISPSRSPRHSPLSLTLLTCLLWWSCILRPSSAVVVPCSVSVPPRGLPQLSPFCPSSLFCPSPPTAGHCDRSPRPSCSCPRPRPPISPVRTKMLEIRQAGLLCVGRWRAGPRPVGKDQVGLT